MIALKFITAGRGQPSACSGVSTPSATTMRVQRAGRLAPCPHHGQHDVASGRSAGGRSSPWYAAAGCAGCSAMARTRPEPTKPSAPSSAMRARALRQGGVAAAVSVISMVRYCGGAVQGHAARHHRQSDRAVAAAKRLPPPAPSAARRRPAEAAICAQALSSPVTQRADQAGALGSRNELGRAVMPTPGRCQRASASEKPSRPWRASTFSCLEQELRT